MLGSMVSRASVHQNEPELLVVVTYKSAGLQNIVEKISRDIDELGYELLHTELTQQGKQPLLRIYIDAPGGIRVDDCEAVSNRVSMILDVEDPIRSKYILEVSSPGLDRPLVRPEHFQRFVGDKARIVMMQKMSGRKHFLGEINQAGESSVTIAVDGELFELPYEDIKSARIDPVYE
ncbi:MAG: ribosome maturation factor RimP [Gammaproteobacteria bacterium]|nr:ribosome maturation factor RimP [Gammaproteobacteria bacterium]MCY4219104.1 ribosome maturation factor RimP [Gammaproteobacteria bacterium]